MRSRIVDQPQPTTATTGATAGAIEVRELTKTHGRGTGAVHALRGVTVAMVSGSFTAVMGPSGSGKSTFLQCAAGLDRPTSGQVVLGGRDLGGLSEAARTKLRRQEVGFVFQAYNLLPALTVEQNIHVPFRLAGKRPDRRRTDEVMERVGLSDRAHHRPAQLSGGQQQRVAIARALVARPQVLFADEPTGALDTGTSREVLGLLRSSVDHEGLTVVMVTHDPNAAAHADAVLFLADGRIVDRLTRPTAESIADRMTALGS